jgi:hypothetical protein
MNVKGIRAPVIENSFGRQMKRIGQGVKSGELTKSEAKSLLREQGKIAKDVYDAKKDDGLLGPKERKSIRAEQRQASKDIFLAKHNDKSR